MKFIFTFSLLLTTAACLAQNVGIGTTTPNGSAQLDVSSTSRGILIPRMTTVAVSGISNPAKGLMIYDSTRNQLLVNMGTPATPDWENIIANSGWGLLGNTLTAEGSAIETKTNFDLRFIVNNVAAGTIDSLYGNTVLGYHTMPVVSFGNAAAIATQDVYMGYEAGMTGVGNFNTGVGYQALMKNISVENTAIGYRVMPSNETGLENTGVGNFALEANIAGDYNSALGWEALGNTRGSFNTAVGEAAMLLNNQGNYNTALGVASLFATVNSDYNTAVGYYAGRNWLNGYNNVFVGANTDVNANGYFNVIAIGQATVCTASSQARFGNPATNSIGSYANWTNFSDGRYKKNMKEDVKGLDFILRLRPLTYNLDISAIDSHLRNSKTAKVDPRMQQAMAQRETEILSGFSAQEVEIAAKAANYEFSGVDKPKNVDDFYGLRYGDFVVPLVKAVQEQQKMIETLQKEITDLKHANH